MTDLEIVLAALSAALFFGCHFLYGIAKANERAARSAIDNGNVLLRINERMVLALREATDALKKT